MKTNTLTRRGLARLAGPRRCRHTKFQRIEGEERIKVLASHRHQRKLRRGEHRANRFQIVLRQVDQPIDIDALTQSFETGFPNYFGPQRFGRHNLDDALLAESSSRPARCAPCQPPAKRLASIRAAKVFNELWLHGWRTAVGKPALQAMLLVSVACRRTMPWGRCGDGAANPVLERRCNANNAALNDQTPDNSQSQGRCVKR